MKSQFKKGQHVVCRYDGDNGDLIVGRIVSVRTSGSIELRNLLHDDDAPPILKQADVLAKRNIVVKKREAEKVVKFAMEHDMAETRKFALSLHRVFRIPLEKERVVRVPVAVLVMGKDRCSNDCPWNSQQVQEEDGPAPMAVPWCSLYDEEMEERTTRSPHKRVRCSMCLTGQLKDEEVVDEAAGPALTLLPGGLQ